MTRKHNAYLQQIGSRKKILNVVFVDDNFTRVSIVNEAEKKFKKLLYVILCYVTYVMLCYAL